MNSTFIFAFAEKHPSKKMERTAVIFCPEAQPCLSDSEDEIRVFFDSSIPPDVIYLLVSGSLEDEELKQVYRDKKLQDLITSYVDSDASRIKLLTFDHKGQLHVVATEIEEKERLDRSIEFPVVKAEKIKMEGMQEIFCRRHGILEASTTHHYIKPSGRHCNKFIRIANVLRSSSEINFLAFCLLPHIEDEITHIYCDTASIHSLAYAVSYLRSHFVRVKSDYVIDSFGSYSGLDTFKFQNAQTAIVLISVSTSGELVEKIMKAGKSIDHSRIITLFYLSSENSDYTTLCKLLKCSANPRGLEEIINYKGDDCILCNQGSVCIKIVGDQFLPENPRSTSHLIKATEAPNWLDGFLSQFKGRDVIKCHYNNQGIPERFVSDTREVFLDVAPFYKEESQLLTNNLDDASKFFRRWHKIMEQSIPASLCRIIHLNDRASQELALTVKQKFEAQLGRNPGEIELKSAEELKLFNETDVRERGATIIVCGCMCTGRKLMSVSQSLRNIQTNGAIIYLVGISRTPDKAAYEEIRSNLIYGDVPTDYGFHCVRLIHCRDSPAQVNNSWQDESRYLTDLQEEEMDEEAARMLKSRKSTLDSVGQKRGLTNNVFWHNASEAPLRLRPNMAFVSFVYAEGEISQAEVYFAISSILHKLRDSGQKEAPLTQYEHHRVVLSPACFYRYNDGVIQSAILRAANRAELDYSISREYSEQMHDVLTYIFDNWDNQVGEATIEFLVALGMGKLKLRTKELHKLLEALRDKPSIPPLLNFLSKQILEQEAKKSAASDSQFAGLV